jgi:adenylate cyclase
MSDAPVADNLLRQVGHRLRSRVPVAHLIGAILAAVSGALTSASADTRGEHGFGVWDLTALIVYLAITGPLGVWSGWEIYRRATRWVSDRREPTPDELRAIFRMPWHLAIQGMIGWLGAAVIWTGLTSVSHDGGYTARVAMSILLGGITTSGLVYLSAEWTLRPLVALALADRAPEHRLAPGVRVKLMVAWIVGSDVFLLMIGLSFVGRPASRPPGPAATWFIIAAGLLAGTLVVHVASRSLATPLLELRRGVGRVQRGDLDVQLTVDDGSEIGLLQAGFNQMVAGLRERAVLSDLFGRHVGEAVAREAIAAGDVVLGGQRREVAVIFVDIIGSTRLAQTRAPEDVVAVLNNFFGTVVRVVSSEGGWVNKFEGDGALCVFGAPVPSEDYATRALRAARTLRRELLVLAASVPEMEAAIGVSAGSVVAGNVGAEERYEYTVIGTPVNVASRLTEEAKGRLGRVLASEDVIARGGGDARAWQVGGEVQLRGYDEPILAYEPADRDLRVRADQVARPETRLIVAARITAPNTYDSKAWRSARRRYSADCRSVSETWKVIPIVNAR